MSAFDDEFGLFGEEDVEVERRSTLGARKIASNETVIDDIEPEDDAPPRRRGGGAERAPEGRFRRGGFGKTRREGDRNRQPADPEAARERAGALLKFLAQKLVSKAEAVSVETFPAEAGDPPIIELLVDAEDLGKVIGRNGRVAQALRTIVRATAEGKVAVDIYDNDEGEGENEGASVEDGDGGAG